MDGLLWRVGRSPRKRKGKASIDLDKKISFTWLETRQVLRPRSRYKLSIGSQGEQTIA